MAVKSKGRFYHIVMQKTFLYLDIILLVGVALFIFFALPKIIYYIIGMFSHKPQKLPKSKTNHKFALLIPARNESAVIEKLLQSLDMQTFPRECFDIFVAVESGDDPTCAIAKSYDAEVYIKQDFSHNGKGYVLEELIDYIFHFKEDKNYEAFMIIDADNILASDYLEKMNNALDAGYDIALGYRNSKNWNSGWVSACTGLTFTRFSHFQNYAKSKFNSTVYLSGTCYYIKTDIVKEHGGWIWHSLTEDVQLTSVAAINGYNTIYLDDAVFYDEQPTDVRTSFNQRRRWLKGFFDNKALYKTDLQKGVFAEKSNSLACFEMSLGSLCMICFAFCFAIYTLGNFGVILANIKNIPVVRMALIRLLLSWAGYFLALYLDTAIMLITERKRIKMKPSKKLQAIIMRPVYSLMYIPVAISTLFKQVEWTPIKHNINAIDDLEKTDKVKK